MSTISPVDHPVIPDQPKLSAAAIAIICVCVVVGLSLLTAFFCLVLCRNKTGFIAVEEGSLPPPPPETHDLVFSSILEHPPPLHHPAETTMFEDGYERHDDDKILMSLARQEWTEQYRPSTPQQPSHHQQRWSSNSSYHVW